MLNKPYTLSCLFLFINVVLHNVIQDEGLDGQIPNVIRTKEEQIVSLPT